MSGQHTVPQTGVTLPPSVGTGTKPRPAGPCPRMQCMPTRSNMPSSAWRRSPRAQARRDDSVARYVARSSTRRRSTRPTPSTWPARKRPSRWPSTCTAASGPSWSAWASRSWSACSPSPSPRRSSRTWSMGLTTIPDEGPCPWYTSPKLWAAVVFIVLIAINVIFW